MALGRPMAALMVTADERVQLESLAHRARSAPHLARRARIILACAAGHQSQVVATRLRVAPATVWKWRKRFVRERIAGLYDEPRPGAPRRISDAQVEAVIVRTLEATPRGATHWSTREMARASGLGHTTIAQIWRAFGLQPHRSETFKLSTDPLLVEKVRDIVGLYMQPPLHAVVFCVDEKGADSSLGSHAAGPADAAGPGRATHPRLPPARHDDVVRRAEREDPRGDYAVSSAASCHRVSAVPRCDRRRRAGAPRRAPDHGQLRHTQDAADPPAGWPSGRGFTSTSPRPTDPGSTSWNAGSPT